jgi:hypothetical protein
MASAGPTVPFFVPMSSSGAPDSAAPLIIWSLSMPREPGSITVIGRFAPQAAKDPRVHLVGYGSSASTIGANHAGTAAAKELRAFLGEEKR